MHTWDIQVSAIEDSKNLLKKNGNSSDKRGLVMQKEKRFLRPMMFGTDDRYFTLESIAVSARSLAMLPDDGKVRMTDHYTTHRSHKHGYSCDGINVSLIAARSMDRERYLELMRETEDNILNNLALLKLIEDDEHQSDMYRIAILPDCLIMTEHMLVTLPRPGGLKDRGHWTTAWKSETRLETNNLRSVLEYSPINIYNIDGHIPFNLNVVSKSQRLSAADARTLNSLKEETAKETNLQLNAVMSNMKAAEQFIARMNDIHGFVSGKTNELDQKVQELLARRREAERF
jgi:hypothetical protein